VAVRIRAGKNTWLVDGLTREDVDGLASRIVSGDLPAWPSPEEKVPPGMKTLHGSDTMSDEELRAGRWSPERLRDLVRESADEIPQPLRAPPPGT